MNCASLCCLIDPLVRVHLYHRSTYLCVSLLFLFQVIDLDRSSILSRACGAMHPPQRFGFVRPLPAVLLALVFSHLTVIDNVVESLGPAPERSLLSVELFSGEAAISNAVRQKWGLAGSFDKRYHDSQDLASEAGFSIALAMVWQDVLFGMLGRACL